MGARVLVTGADGFLGRPSIEELLARGLEVHGAVRAAHGSLPHGATEHAVDLLAADAVAALIERSRPTHLLHLAWYTTPGQFWNAPENLDWVAASLALVRAFAAHGGRRAVIAGTCAEYDWNSDYLEEGSTPMAPRSLYGVSKNALREVLTAAAAPLGLSLAWGRIFYLYGPRENPVRLVPSVITSMLQGRPAACSQCLQQRDLLHVQDAAGAFATALCGDFAGAFNVASGRCLPLRTVVEMLGRLTGRSDLIRFGERATPADEPARLAAATAILQRRIGFEPRYDLAEGLAQTVDWWRAQCAAR
jgi:nucleoside-diphosphate-sugar epimerase